MMLDKLKLTLMPSPQSQGTNNLYMATRKEFSKLFRCLIQLLLATELSNTVIVGMGCTHMLALNSDRLLPIRTFFHPLLWTTVINEQDLLQANGRNVCELSSELLKKHHGAGTWTFAVSSYHKESRRVVVHGILLARKCNAHPLIPCFEDEMVRSAVVSLRVDDPDFASRM